jgi:DNA polymerase V
VVASRSFGRPVVSLEEMEEALAHHASRVGERLRAQGGLASNILVFVQTNTFIAGEPQYSMAQSAALAPPTDRTPDLVRKGREVLRRIFRPGYRYKKVGVMLSGIEAAASAQLSLLSRPDGRGGRLMSVLDAVNAKWGRDTLFCAAMGVERAWRMRQAWRSPRYTTVWSELPVVSTGPCVARLGR